MSEEINNLVLRHLQTLREGVSDIKAGQLDIQHRLTLLEQGQAQIYASYAGQSERLDRIESRLGRIERRLELRDAD